MTTPDWIVLIAYMAATVAVGVLLGQQAFSFSPLPKHNKPIYRIYRHGAVGLSIELTWLKQRP